MATLRYILKSTKMRIFLATKEFYDHRSRNCIRFLSMINLLNFLAGTKAISV